MGLICRDPRWGGKNRGRRRVPALPHLLLAGSALALLPAPACPQVRVSVLLVDTAVIQSPLLRESSGVAPSSRRRGVFWTHNDSGNRPLLFAIDSAGSDLGFVRVEGASPRDWEDLALGPCFRAAGRCLYIADTGDNARRRPSISVYRLPEPEPPAGASDTLSSVPILDSLVFTYPDGPHDAEALAIASSGHLLLVTKEWFAPPVLFRGALADGGGVLERVGPLAMRGSAAVGRLATGAALSPGDSLLVVRTYVSLSVFRLRMGLPPEALTPPEGITIPVVEPQGEAVTFDGPTRLLLTSEHGQSENAILTRLLLRLDRR